MMTQFASGGATIIEPYASILVNRAGLTIASGGSAPAIISTSALNVDLNADDPESWSFTTGAITNGVVIVGITMSKASFVSSCTFDGTSMTALAQIANVDGTTRAEIWGLVVASKGAGTYTVSPFGTSGAKFKGVAQSWSGATSFGTGVTATNTGINPTVSITSGANDIVWGCCATDGTGTFNFTVGSGFTAVSNSTTANNINHLTEYKQNASAADCTNSGSVPWAIAAVAIKP